MRTSLHYDIVTSHCKQKEKSSNGQTFYCFICQFLYFISYEFPNPDILFFYLVKSSFSHQLLFKYCALQAAIHLTFTNSEIQKEVKMISAEFLWFRFLHLKNFTLFKRYKRYCVLSKILFQNLVYE